MGQTSYQSSIYAVLQRPRLIWILPALSAILLVGAIFLFLDYRRSSDQLRAAGDIAASLDAHIANASQVLDSLSQIAGNAGDGELEGVLRTARQTSPYFSDYYIIDRDGRFTAGSQSSTPQSSSIPLSELELLPGVPAPVGDSSDPFLYLDQESGLVDVYIAHPLAGGKTLVGRLDAALLQESLNSGAEKVVSRSVYLADSRGLVLARSNPEDSGQWVVPVFSGGWRAGTLSTRNLFFQNTRLSTQASVRLANADWWVVDEAPLNSSLSPYLFGLLIVLIALCILWLALAAAFKWGDRPISAAAVALPVVPASTPIWSRPRSLESQGTAAHETEHEQRVLAEALRDTASALNSSLSYEEVMERILDNVARVAPHHSSNIMLIGEDGDTVRIVATRGYKPLNLQGYPDKLCMSITNTSTLSRMAESRRPLIIPNTVQDPHWINIPETSWIRSYAAAPIMIRENVIGFLSLNSPTPNFFRESLAERLMTFADQAGIAMHNARLFQDLQLSNQELKNAYDITLQGWSKALELRDYETEGHSQRVVNITLEIAARMGMTEQELVNIRYGVLLHDIGKIGIPDSILFKPGPLSHEEWKIMRRHPQYALDILASIPYLASAIDIPYNHHERWDGTGYPRGLKGEEIPLSARIFAIVDVWDGLRSSRPYHASWTDEEAIRYIKSQSGKQFDPAVIDAFLQVILLP